MNACYIFSNIFINSSNWELGSSFIKKQLLRTLSTIGILPVKKSIDNKLEISFLNFSFLLLKSVQISLTSVILFVLLSYKSFSMMTRNKVFVFIFRVLIPVSGLINSLSLAYTAERLGKRALCGYRDILYLALIKSVMCPLTFSISIMMMNVPLVYEMSTTDTMLTASCLMILVLILFLEYGSITTLCYSWVLDLKIKIKLMIASSEVKFVDLEDIHEH